MQNFSQRLNQLHQNSGQSQQAATEMIKRKTGEDVHQTTFGNWLRGDREPVLSAIITLSLAYGVSMEWLSGLVEDKRPVAVLLERIRELTFPADVEKVARLLSTMPPEQRRVHIARIEADFVERKQNDERWRYILKSVQAAGISLDDFEQSITATAKIEIERIPETLFELAR